MKPTPSLDTSTRIGPSYTESEKTTRKKKLENIKEKTKFTHQQNKNNAMYKNVKHRPHHNKMMKRRR